MKVKNVLRILVLVLILICLNVNVAFCADSDEYTNPNQFDNHSDSNKLLNGAGAVDNTINNTAGVVLSVLRVALTCVAVIAFIIMGIRYLVAEPGMKAEMKKNMPTFFIGVVILFGAAGLLNILTHFVTAVF